MNPIHRTQTAPKKHPGGFRKDRPRPTAYLTDSPYPTGDTRRRIILSTGRGDTRIDADEADALAAELVAAAKIVRERGLVEVSGAVGGRTRGRGAGRGQ
jgi:hypothetical protein